MNKQPIIQEHLIEVTNVEFEEALPGPSRRLNCKFASTKDVKKWQHEILNTSRNIKKTWLT